MVPVTNTGLREGTEVVQLYVRNNTDAEGPGKSLRGFRRITLAPGETGEVTFPLDADVFLSWNEQKQDMIPMNGAWTLLYGGSSDALQELPYERK